MKRAGLLALLVAALVVAFVIAKGSGDNNGNRSTTSSSSSANGSADGSTTSAPAGPQVINVVGGKPEGGIQKITVSKGDPVRFKVVSDVADEIHVHGYNFMKDVKKGGSVSFSFPAKIDGIFEIELEGRKQQIAELQVNQ